MSSYSSLSTSSSHGMHHDGKSSSTNDNDDDDDNNDDNYNKISSSPINSRGVSKLTDDNYDSIDFSVTETDDDSQLELAENFEIDSSGFAESNNNNDSNTSSTSIFAILLGWLAMALAIFSGAGSGPMFKWMMNEGITPLLAASWRCQCMSIFLIPLAIFEAIKTGEYIDFMASKPDLKFRVWVHVLVAGVGWSMTLLFWINGLNYISTVRASLLVNLHPLVLVIYLNFTGAQVDILDWVGVVIAIGGVALINIMDLLEPENNSGSSNSGGAGEEASIGNQLFGAMLCIIAAIGECMVIINRKKIKKYVPLMQYTAVTTGIVCVIAMVYALIFEESLAFGLSPRSLWGWCGHKWAIPIVLFGLINGVVCQAGFNFAMQYIHPLVFSSTLLLTPPVTGFLSWMMNVEGAPDKFTWIGGFVILLGIAMIQFSEHKRKTAIEEEEKKALSCHNPVLSRSDFAKSSDVSHDSSKRTSFSRPDI